jgi:integrase
MGEGSTTRGTRLLDQVRQAIRVRHYSYRTEQQYVAWIRRYIRFHGTRHPRELGGAEVSAFLTHLVTSRNVAAATQNQALPALLFLYKNVLDIELPWLDQVIRSKRPRRLPVVLTRAEVREVLKHLSGPYWLVASLLYGSGLRLLEALSLRVKDIDLERRSLVVRDAKGQKDRVTVLPDSLVDPLRRHLAEVRRDHERAVAAGFGGVECPTRCSGNIPVPTWTMVGSSSFPRTSRRTTRAPARGDGITCTPRPYSARFAAQFGQQGLSGRPRATPSGIPSRRTCLNRATTSVRSRSCWATATSARHRSTRMC